METGCSDAAATTRLFRGGGDGQERDFGTAAPPPRTPPRSSPLKSRRGAGACQTRPGTVPRGAWAPSRTCEADIRRGAAAIARGRRRRLRRLAAVQRALSYVGRDDLPVLLRRDVFLLFVGRDDHRHRHEQRPTTRHHGRGARRAETIADLPNVGLGSRNAGAPIRGPVEGCRVKPRTIGGRDDVTGGRLATSEQSRATADGRLRAGWVCVWTAQSSLSDPRAR